ncbi:conserved hypothetical protein [Ricinus communis]|uniref:Uncharacterized protein n=1 Tax=Ricinus communis TaxID=3988 RepID=B9RCF5_RICCO|nr:conserved hypothetical protein [Ricinus communis]
MGIEQCCFCIAERDRCWRETEIDREGEGEMGGNYIEASEYNDSRQRGRERERE